MKLALLAPLLTCQFASGVQTFVREVEKTGTADIIYLTRRQDALERYKNIFPNAQIPENTESNYRCYNGTIVTTFLYESEDMGIIADYPHPRILYLHDHTSVKHGLVSWVKEYIDVIAYDRPRLAEFFIAEHPDINLPYRELTLPYAPANRDKGMNFQLRMESNTSSDTIYLHTKGAAMVSEGKDPKRFITHGRFAPHKRMELIIEAAKMMPDFQFDVAGSWYSSKNKGHDYASQIVEEMKQIDNINPLYNPLGSSWEQISASLDISQYYLGLTSDLSGSRTYGIEYSAMEAMDYGCVPIINEEMEFEYRRHGARAMFVDANANKRLDVNLLAIYNGGRFLIDNIVNANRIFLNTKNIRFKNQLDAILEEYKYAH